MLIPSSNFNTVILLMEVDLNCEIIARSTEKLRIAAMHRINLSQGIDDAGKATKIDIITDCFACLTAAAAVSRLLCLGDRKGKRADRIKQRCDLLMNELGNPSISALNSLRVRNSWEHLDERLDDILESQTCRSHSQIHVSPTPPSQGTFVSRHFDPNTLEIKLAGDVFSLGPIAEEALLLSRQANLAIKRITITNASF
jgi:hypothetical protein